MSSGVLIPRIEALLILDDEGNRVAVKYFSPAAGSPTFPEFKDFKSQQAFEKRLNGKLSRSSARLDSEILILDSFTIVYKFLTDVAVCVISVADENELMVQSVCQAVDESLNQLLKGQVAKKTLIENLDLVLLTMDEIIHEGLLLENDSNLVVSRVCMTGGGDKEVPLAEQSFTQALQTAKDQFYKSFRS